MSTGKILITGATGGRAIERLRKLGREVRALALTRGERLERFSGATYRAAFE